MSRRDRDAFAIPRGVLRRRSEGSRIPRREGSGSFVRTPHDVRVIRANAGGRPYDVAVGGAPRREDWDEQREYARAVADAGATWFVEWVAPADAAAMRGAVERGPLRVD